MLDLRGRLVGEFRQYRRARCVIRYVVTNITDLLWCWALCGIRKISAVTCS